MSRSLSRIIFLEPDPHAMRFYAHKSDRLRHQHGENSSGVIYHLYKNKGTKTEPIVLKSFPIIYFSNDNKLFFWRWQLYEKRGVISIY